MPKILVTGASGFVGRHLCAHLVAQGCQVVAAIRQPGDVQRMPAALARQLVFEVVGEVGANTDWRAALAGCDGVVHLAGRAHVMQEGAHDAMEAFRAVNVAGSICLAEQAVEAGVGRMVFISSIGVNGEATTVSPFSETSRPEPHSTYARSKLEAELALQQRMTGSATELVVLRPPLVYGHGAPGNFARLIKLVQRAYVLPFESIHNRRSFIYIGNLVDVIANCLRHPAAAGELFLLSDGEDISTPDLMRLMARSMGCRRLFVGFPVRLMRLLGELVGAAGAVRRLTDSLEIDSRRVRQKLGWVPPFTLEQGLQATLAQAAGHGGGA